MKQIYYYLLLFTFALTACQAPDGDIYILYDNDVHCAIDGYEKMAALKADYLHQSIYVNVVSCGDFVQGNKVGSISKGRYPVAIMNAVPYDYVTLGNHEFDYGIPQMKKLMWWLRAKCVCCNVDYEPTGKPLYPAYDIRTYGTTDVAFVGVATPTTLTTSVPTNFQNEKGEILYNFHRDDLMEVVQKAVNAARADGADYVVVLSHLGDNTPEVSSMDLIANTTGIDVVLDGHAHHLFNMKVTNAVGDSVIVASTGHDFSSIGRLLITKEGQLSNELIDMASYEGTHSRLHTRIASVMKRVNAKTDRYVGFAQMPLVDSDADGNRLVRLGETNLGDFVADAMRVVSKSDIGIANAGGLRASLKAGNITYGDVLQVLPFNNTLYKIEVSGQRLIDALEIGVAAYPKENGDLLHVSGIRYSFDPSIPSSIHLDVEGFCDSIGDSRRVQTVEIERNGEWLPIHPDSMYTVGGQSYNLVFDGSSGMFRNTQLVDDIEHISDVDVVIRYMGLLGDTIRVSQYGKSQERIRIL
ncbi:MAG: bifunctional metallophosphatase/5'-nucleotidase [Paludibacteraceae bacterium]|nr:bifunctional metallophosphatase/5'-nucleotidase [Paludibacteraceae bacterium]